MTTEKDLERLVAYQVPVFKSIARHIRKVEDVTPQQAHLYAVDLYASRVRETYEQVCQYREATA